MLCLSVYESCTAHLTHLLSSQSSPHTVLTIVPTSGKRRDLCPLSLHPASRDAEKHLRPSSASHPKHLSAYSSTHFCSVLGTKTRLSSRGSQTSLSTATPWRLRESIVAAPPRETNHQLLLGLVDVTVKIFERPAGRAGQLVGHSASWQRTLGAGMWAGRRGCFSSLFSAVPLL